MTRRFEELDAKSQARIRELVAKAPPLSDRQRGRLELLFREGKAPPGNAATPEANPGPTIPAWAGSDSGTPTRQPGGV